MTRIVTPDEYRCDACDRRMNDASLFWHVERGGRTSLGYDNPDGYDLCSQACLILWAEKRDQIMKGT